MNWHESLVWLTGRSCPAPSICVILGGLPRTLHFLPLWWGVPSTLQFVPSGMAFNAVLAMVNVSTPWSEVAEGTPFASWWENQFGCALPMIQLDSLDQQLEWVTAQSFRAGNNGRLKPFSGLTAEAQARYGGLQPSGAGVVRLVMRPVMCEVADHTPSEVNVAPKERFWGIFVQRTSQRSQWTFQRVSRDCTERSVAGSLLTVYPEAADALDALHKTINSISVPQDQKRSKQNHDANYQRQNMLETAVRLLRACSGRDAVPSTINDTNEPRRSTMWTPVGLARIDSPSEILSSGCPCASGFKFGKWLYYDCGIGHHIVTPNTVFATGEAIIPAVLHNLKFQILSQCRTHPIDIPNIMRGVIDDTDLGSLRVAGTAADFMRSEPSYDMTSDHKEAWDSTDKHKVLWLVPTKLLQTQAGISTGGKGSGGKGSGGSKGSKGNTGSNHINYDNAAEQLWAKGSLHIAMSAPRTAYGKWRLKFQPNVTPDFAGQVTCFTLGWIGNRFYHHECLRRAGGTASPWIGPLIHLMMPNAP